MLDRATLRALAQRPERNDPMLNVALAEEGDITVLVALAGSPGVGPDALARIQARIESEGESVGHVEEADPDDGARRGSRRADGPPLANGSELDAKLVAHPQADPALLDAVLSRHDKDPFFVLAAAVHRRPSERALDMVARWPSATPLHDRTWLGVVDPRAVPPLTLAMWASDESDVAREAAARLALDPAMVAALAKDPSRRVRRAAASNPHADSATIELLRGDAACEVRARAASSSAADAAREPRDPGLESTRFRAAVASMGTGGTLAADVVRSLRTEPLDDDGARLAALALDEPTVAELVSAAACSNGAGLALAAGVAFRRDLARPEPGGGSLVGHCVRVLADADRTGGAMTGKGRLASWLAEGVARVAARADEELSAALQEDTLAADRMVLGRLAAHEAAAAGTIKAILRLATASCGALSPALLEVAWRCKSVPDETVAAISTRLRPLALDGSVEQEIDLDPTARPIVLLEQVGAALIGRAPLAPRAALALVARDPRRVRYILSALPQWKGVLSGAQVARVLKAHAGAISAAGSSGQRAARQASATWTQRRLDEVELAVALAVGDISPGEALNRLETGHTPLLNGPALSAGIEARATLDGPRGLDPLVEYLAAQRTRNAPALAAWLLVEGLDRVRTPTGIAAALDAPWSAPSGPPSAARSMMPPGLAEALAILERRSPGRLASAVPQTPRGRSALASGIARAYRALGGMPVEEA